MVEIITEASSETVTAEPAIQEPVAEAPVIIEAAIIEQPTAPIEEAPTVIIENPIESVAPNDPVEEAAQEQPAVEVPLQAFEVTEQAPIETTLEKVLEEQIVEPVSCDVVEEVHIPAHPLEAPQQAHLELTAETDNSDQTTQAEESEENTTE